MTARAIQASLCDWKNVKTRSVVQLILEIPVEQALAAFQTLGMPQPGTEIPVAVALMNSARQADAGPQTAPDLPVRAPEAESKVADKPRRRFSELPRSQQAGMLCNDERFQKWLGTPNAEFAANWVRRQCIVKSRAELDTIDTAREKWDQVVAEFQQETGQFAEQRA